MILLLPPVTPPQPHSLAVKKDSIRIGGDVTGGQVSLVTLGADSITIAGTVNSALVHGGADNDSMTVGAIVGGTTGGGLGADTLIVNGKVTGAEVLMTSKSDPNSSSDKADSLSVAGSMSNSTVYAGAGADNISVDSHLIAGELFAGSGADTVMVGGSLGGTTDMSDGADSLTAANADAATLLGGTENDTFNFTGDVKNSSFVGGFGADSLVVTDFVRGSTMSTVDPHLTAQVHLMVLTTSALEVHFPLPLFMATLVLTLCSSGVMQRLHLCTVELTMIWLASPAI